MAKQLFILGAGASVTSGPPLIKDFLDVAHDLRSQKFHGLRADVFSDFFEIVIPRLNELYRKSRLDLNNVENVCGLLEMAELVGRLPGASRSETTELVQLLRIVLVQTVMYTTRFRFSGNVVYPTPTYQAFVSQVVETTTRRGDERAFITFNYDIALDYALVHKHIPIDYGMSAERTPSAVQLLKLHGSVNFSQCPKCGDINVIPLTQRLGIVPLGESGQVTLSADSLFDAAGGCLCTPRVQRRHGIAPPSWNKGQHQRAFQGAWRRAAELLSEAQEIYIIGYSLPSSDLFFRDLFAVGLAGPTRVRRIEVVNPSQEVHVAIAGLLGQEVEARLQPWHAMSMDTWLQEYVRRTS